jgi:hypothetical protein
MEDFLEFQIVNDPHEGFSWQSLGLENDLSQCGQFYLQ